MNSIMMNNPENIFTILPGTNPLLYPLLNRSSIWRKSKIKLKNKQQKKQATLKTKVESVSMPTTIIDKMIDTCSDIKLLNSRQNTKYDFWFGFTSLYNYVKLNFTSWMAVSSFFACSLSFSAFLFQIYVISFRRESIAFFSRTSLAASCFSAGTSVTHQFSYSWLTVLWETTWFQSSKQREINQVMSRNTTAIKTIVSMSCMTWRTSDIQVELIQQLYDILIKIVMKQIRNRKPITSVKFPAIKQKISPVIPVTSGKSIKLERITQKKNLALIDLAKINKIEKEFTIMTKRNNTHEDQHPPKKDQMRQSRLLLLKEKTPAQNKKNNQNLLSNLVMYHPPENNKKKKINIPQSNISLSPSKYKKVEKPRTAEQMPFQYSNGKQLQKLDFVKMFIVEELLYYIHKTVERSKEEMVGFCKFYNENSDDETYSIISSVLGRSKDYLHSIFYEKIGFYIFLILGTDADLQEEANFLLKSLMGYLHTNNLIILDVLMEIVDIQKLPISSQFHVHNTSRFNEDRRKLSIRTDKMGLLAKNNQSSVELIKSILVNCGFDSLKTFVFEILANENIDIIQKIKEVSMMLVSLDSILVGSLHTIEANKPQPPFLPEKTKQTPYTLVLDMDQTLIHYTQINKNGSLLIRPYCHEFLEEMSQQYELVIFTAAVKEYADSILDTIDKKGLISHRLYREHTRIEDYVSIKDISLINRDLSKAIIVDNIASNFKLQPRNGIAISTWTGDTEDLSLLNLIPVLTKLARSKVQDVRDGLEKLSEYMENKMKSSQDINFDDVNLQGL